MTYNNISDYIAARTEWEQKRLIVTPEFDSKLFYEQNPKPVYEVALIPNPDGTQINTGIVKRK